MGWSEVHVEIRSCCDLQWILTDIFSLQYRKKYIGFKWINTYTWIVDMMTLHRCTSFGGPYDRNDIIYRLNLNCISLVFSNSSTNTSWNPNCYYSRPHCCLEELRGINPLATWGGGSFKKENTFWRERVRFS